MTAGQYLFGFDGRINRAKWWLLVPIQIGAAIVYYVATLALVGASIFSTLGGNLSGLGSSLALAILLWLAYMVAMFFVWLAVTVKRLHDRDRSGAWIWLFAVGPWACYIIGFAVSFGHPGGLGSLFGFAGLAITVWAFIELGCLRGTIGANRFGPDPLVHLTPSQAPAQPT